MQKGGFDEDSVQEARKILEKAAQLNPEFAPAHEALSQAYAHSPDTQKQAVNAAIKAVQLDPGELSYAVNLGYLLLNNSRFSEARIMARRILAAATTAREKEIANEMLQHVQQAEEWAANKTDTPATAQAGKDSPNVTIMTRPAGIARPDTSSDAPVKLKRRVYAAEGVISAVECANKPELMLSVNLSSSPVTFYAPDFAKVAVSWADGVPEPTPSACTQWKGRRVKVWFSPTPGKEYAGEISNLYFF
jgi:hypothetical protein